ncbi:MAG TPA: DNA polymerase III subunit gamma/tau [Acidimicrobiales bacterium]|nr:DNA polymerase III subunit gamma/tau [Acidimicrobiales bacterium]
MADETYQSLYRRYRPTRFAEVRGQDHVTTALRNAARDGRVSQGYLFSGPRGTGKTSTARILAKALNCEKLDDGEPCGVCESCVSVASGSSFAVIELDAASNNGVDAMRDLVSRASLGTTGLRKVYIIDEVHMLSAAASNTLLKTLEEPPSHVVFVLATTDPQKVLPTIISRVQHFQFHLMGAETLGALVRAVNADAGLGLDDGSLDRVVRRGAGSARDALSSLDQAAALGGTEDEVPVAAEVLEALVERDPARALSAVAAGCSAGRDPRRLAEEVLAALRDAFLAGRAPALVDLPPDEVERVAEVARRLGPAALVRAMETVGTALTEMREALDPRVSLEVALVRVTAPEADASPGALLERIERLERRLADGTGTAAPRSVPAAATPPASDSGLPATSDVVRPASTDAAGPPAGGGQPGPHNLPTIPPARPVNPRPTRPAPAGTVQPPPPAPAGRGALGSFRGVSRPTPAPAAPDAAPVAAAPTPAGADELPSRDELSKAWGDAVLGTLRGRTKALYAAGRFLAVEGGHAVFALPDAAHRDQCAKSQPDVEAALAAHFGRGVPLRLVADKVSEGDGARAAAAAADADDEAAFADIAALREAPAMTTDSPADRIRSAFPGAEEVQP